ncbi:MAG: zinc ABC transporter substrate-binding protein [Dinoroseobacter sp.]|nr:zinc ABC transporter substrate-binding protein [Dinoroseobacter sp.]
MSRKLIPLSLTAALMGGTAMAEVPSVAVDIAPVHSLVARVMQGVGTPNLIVPAEASPHQYNLRPSEAATLQEADVVFWLGEDLTPWMEDAVETLAEGASVTALLEADGTILHDFREGALFEEHDHGDHEDHAEGEDHDHDHDHEEAKADDHDHDHDHEEAKADDHDHDHDHEEAKADDHDHDHDHEEAKADDHDHEEHAHEGHDHGEHDPHAWLSIANAATWLDLIAGQLSAADPDNAGAYFANAAAGKAELEELVAEVSGILDPVRGGSFVAFHDAYQYFEVDFDFPASGAISLGDATDPSPARIAEIQERVREESIGCVLAEPQYNPGIVATVLDGTEASTAVVDPLGVGLDIGPELYPQLIRNMATTLADCL